MAGLLIVTIYLFVAGAPILLGTLSSLSSMLVAVGLVFKSEHLYDKREAVASKGRRAANGQASLREILAMQDEVFTWGVSLLLPDLLQ